MAKESTREVLLEVGGRCFLERGYTNSGIELILQAANVPKGSFYHYFDSKEDFGLQVLERFAAGYDEAIDVALGNESVRPIDRLRGYFEQVIRRIESQQCRNGCLVGRLSQELADQNELFRARLEIIFERWVDRYADCLDLAQDRGEIAAGLDTRELAEFCLNAWQGAVQRAKTMHSTAPLHTFLVLMFDHLLRPCS